MSDDRGISLAREALASIPELAGFDGDIERLGGLTNLVFRVGNFCLRLPGKGRKDIDRANEAVAACEAALVGVSPEVLHFDPASGVMVTRFVVGAVTMTPRNFRDRMGSPARVAKIFRRPHDSTARFTFRFELFSMIDDYLKVLSGKEIVLPKGYQDVVAEAGTVRAALDAHPVPLTACHCDPLCENFLDSGERMWIVDWEYAGMNDPLWDLRDLSVEAGFDAAQDEEMMRAYFGGEPRSAERGRFVIYKAMCDLLWTLWGLIQLANNNPSTISARMPMAASPAANC